MRVVVIGGNNFIGPYVVRSLLDGSHEVTLFNRGGSDVASPAGVRWIQGDRAHLTRHREEFESLSPDVVIDMVALSEHDARGMVDTFTGIADRAVVISSMDVYRAYDIVRGMTTGSPDPTPLTENSPLRDNLYPYERSGVEEYEKILVEKVARGKPELPTTVLRLPAVYGPGDYRHRMYGHVRRMRDKRPAILLQKDIADWRFTHGYVEDVAAAITLASTDERAKGRTYNVGEEPTPTLRERIQRLGKVMGWDGEVLSVPKADLPESLREEVNTDQDWAANTTRLREELGYREMVPPEEALRRTAEWEEAHPPEDSQLPVLNYLAEDTALKKLLW